MAFSYPRGHFMQEKNEKEKAVGKSIAFFERRKPCVF